MCLPQSSDPLPALRMAVVKGLLEGVRSAGWQPVSLHSLHVCKCLHTQQLVFLLLLFYFLFFKFLWFLKVMFLVF